LIHSSAERSRLAQQYRLLGFDMEGDGVSDSAYLQGADWFMVRGVSDYGVGKNDQWHRYASLAAAAYLRALLGQTAPLDARPFGTGSFDAAPLATAPLDEPSGPGPAGANARHGDLDIDAIVAALLAVRTMRDRSDRDRVIEALPAIYRTRQARASSTYHDVKELVENLRRIPGGLHALYRVLLKIEQESTALRRLSQLIDE
jgi:hypothetical protein